MLPHRLILTANDASIVVSRLPGSNAAAVPSIRDNGSDLLAALLWQRSLLRLAQIYICLGSITTKSARFDIQLLLRLSRFCDWCQLPISRYYRPQKAQEEVLLVPSSGCQESYSAAILAASLRNQVLLVQCPRTFPCSFAAA